MIGEFLNEAAIRIERDNEGDYKVFRLIENGQEIGTNKLAKSPIHEPVLRDCFPETPVAYQLFINEEHRGRGLSKLLMDAVEQDARDSGASELLLGVVEDNKLARGIYERRGYRYLEFYGSQTVESLWCIQNDQGEQTQVNVQVMPMILDLRQAESA